MRIVGAEGEDASFIPVQLGRYAFGAPSMLYLRPCSEVAIGVDVSVSVGVGVSVGMVAMMAMVTMVRSLPYPFCRRLEDDVTLGRRHVALSKCDARF